MLIADVVHEDQLVARRFFSLFYAAIVVIAYVAVTVAGYCVSAKPDFGIWMQQLESAN